LAPWIVCPACDDNVTCVFTDGCRDGGGPIAENEAIRPVDGEWVQDGPPELDSVFPSGIQGHASTPIVLVFSESMQESSLSGAFEIVPMSGGPGGQPVAATQALVADGRLLVLLPTSPLAPGTFQVRLDDQALVLDLTGEELEQEPGTIGSFTVTATPPAAPRLVTTFPADGATNQSDTPEIVVVFDRNLRPQSVTPASFDVRVGSPPADPPNDPPAAPLMVSTASGTRADTRVFLYRSVNVEGRPASLGTDTPVELRLTAAIEDLEGDDLVADTITFRTLPFLPPKEASLPSVPHDAIGLANLTAGNAEELEVEVELEVAAGSSDFVDLFLFGAQRSDERDPPLIALQRSKRLSGTSTILTRIEVGIQEDLNVPGDVRFEDGAVSFAFRVRRGAVVSPLRLLDLDPDPDTIQDPLLDTLVPAVETLIGSSGTDAFRSDLRGLSLAGTARGEERLRSVEVSTPLATNGALPPVVGASDEGLFLAAPVGLDLLSGGTTSYDFVARDEALNAAPVASGTFTQLGAVGPAAFTPGDSIEVEVFDSRTLLPLAGCLVLVHSEEGGGAFPLAASGTTLATGRVVLQSSGASVGAIVTVACPEFDLFTLHGVPSTRLSVPLVRTSQPTALASGEVLSTDAAAVSFLPGMDRRYDDSRRSVELPRGFAGGGCPPASQGVLTCPFGPEAIADGRLGARSFLAGVFLQTEAAFNPSQFLQAFVLSLPLAPAGPGALQPSTLEVPQLLIDPGSPAEDDVQATPPFLFRVDGASGVDLLDLRDDPDTPEAVGAPFVSVDALVPGLPGSIGVGNGLAFDQGGGDWRILGALAGAITAGGSLGRDGVVEGDPFVRVEVIDGPGNAAGARPRIPAILAGGAMPEFRALAVPTQLEPPPSAQTGDEAFTLRLTHAIDDSQVQPGRGLYRVLLRDAAGRRWSLWRFDPPGTDPVEIRVVDVGEAGGAGLMDGTLTSSVSAYAWGTLSATNFLWSDVERLFELFSRAAPVSFTKP
jgi:hypothetical protein